jgi:hypothetical protein
MGDISIHVNVSDSFSPLLKKVAAETPGGLRNALDRTARRAYNEAKRNVVADVGSADAKAGISTLKRPSAYDLSARFSLYPQRITARKIGKFIPGKSWNRGSFSGHTSNISPGRSKNLNISKAFVIRNNADIVMVRVGSGKNAIKAVYATHPATTFKEAKGGKPAELWKQDINQTLPNELNKELAKVFAGGSAGASGGD